MRAAVALMVRALCERIDTLGALAIGYGCADVMAIEQALRRLDLGLKMRS